MSLSIKLSKILRTTVYERRGDWATAGTGIVEFSALPKKKMGDEFEQRIVFWRLLVWMADKADIDDKEKIIKDFISNKRKSKEIKKAIWEAIRNA